MLSAGGAAGRVTLSRPPPAVPLEALGGAACAAAPRSPRSGTARPTPPPTSGESLGAPTAAARSHQRTASSSPACGLLRSQPASPVEKVLWRVPYFAVGRAKKTYTNSRSQQRQLCKQPEAAKAVDQDRGVEHPRSTLASVSSPGLLWVARGPRATPPRRRRHCLGRWRGGGNPLARRRKPPRRLRAPPAPRTACPPHST